MQWGRCPRFMLMVLVGGLAGCGGDGHRTPEVAEATLTVTINGQPLPQAKVTLTPTESGFGASAIAMGVTDDAGKVTLMCGGKPGACIGTNKVTVVDAAGVEDERTDDGNQQTAADVKKGPKNRPIPARFANLAQSDLTLTIKADQKEYTLDLKR